ncbi:hypothetical protein NEMBOFW57_003552 [Staphylotrichum longicolle]|uniref:Uncharacterized protein n=1 Tax=Staphylotrichum longicolle TaxID=669026 RepID=A0AAD4F5Y0_9PEZI|nr:hypothetical protein NEMBOFW57_003552 [Staphylotrichum longicolle]
MATSAVEDPTSLAVRPVVAGAPSLADTSSPPTKRHRSIGPPRPAWQDSSPPVKGEDDVEDQSLLANIPNAPCAPADLASPPDQKMQKVIFKWGDRRVVNWRPHPRPLGPSPEPSPAPLPSGPPTPDQKMQKVIFKWGDRRVVNWRSLTEM